MKVINFNSEPIGYIGNVAVYKTRNCYILVDMSNCRAYKFIR